MTWKPEVEELRTRRKMAEQMGGPEKVARQHSRGKLDARARYVRVQLGGTNNLQWVEIANTSNLPIDLSTFSIGAGSSDFMRTRMGLSMTIPARGCIVVGGPAGGTATLTYRLTVPDRIPPR